MRINEKSINLEIFFINLRDNNKDTFEILCNEKETTICQACWKEDSIVRFYFIF